MWTHIVRWSYDHRVHMSVLHLNMFLCISRSSTFALNINTHTRTHALVMHSFMRIKVFGYLKFHLSIKEKEIYCSPHYLKQLICCSASLNFEYWLPDNYISATYIRASNINALKMPGTHEYICSRKYFSHKLKHIHSALPRDVKTCNNYFVTVSISVSVPSTRKN